MTDYTWSVSAGGTITSGAGTRTITVSWNAVGAQTVSVNYTDNGFRPVNPTVKNVTVVALPVPTIAGQEIICGVSPTMFFYYTEPLMTGYTWTVSAGGTITFGGGTDAIAVIWNTLGAQTVSVNYANANGCVAANATEFPVAVNPLNQPTITGPESICRGTAGNVYFTESGMTNYTWLVSSGGTITAGEATHAITVLWSSDGAQDVSVNYTNGSGCTAASPTVKRVTVKPLPIPGLMGHENVCETSVETYTTEPGMSNYVWSVIGGVITGGEGTNVLSVIWTETGDQSVRVNYTIADGCSGAIATVLPVHVYPVSIPSITGPVKVCIGTYYRFDTEPGMTDYWWEATGTTAEIQQVGPYCLVMWTQTGDQYVRAYYTNQGGCESYSTLQVTVYPRPVPTITGPTSICQGTKNNFYSTQAGMTGYFWTVSVGGTIVSGAGTNSINVTWNNDGAQNVSVNYIGTNGCDAAAVTVLPVVVNPYAPSSLTGPHSTCLGEPGNVYTAEPGMTNYQWEYLAPTNEGQVVGPNSISITWNIPMPNIVFVSYTSQQGCPTASAVYLNVDTNPSPEPTITGPSPVCQWDSLQVYTTEPGMSGYSWTVSSGGIVEAGGTPADNRIFITWTGDGAQTVSVDYINGYGCTATNATVLSVTVIPSPKPIISGPAEVCAGTTGVTYTTQSLKSDYNWTVPWGGIVVGGGKNTDNYVTVDWPNSGTQYVQVVFQNGNGCYAKEIKNVTVHPLPVPTITGPSSVCSLSKNDFYTTEPGMSNTIWTNLSGGYIWSFGPNDYTLNIGWLNPGPASQVGIITVNVIDQHGCPSLHPTAKYVTVNPLPEPTITGPDAFCAKTVQTFTTESGMTGCAWTISEGGTILTGTGTNEVTASWNSSGVQTISVNYTNGNGCAAEHPTVKRVTIKPLPDPVISGPATACAGTCNVTYSTELSMIAYIWTVSPGGTITAGGTVADPTVTVCWNTAGPQSVSVNYLNENGCFAPNPPVKNITVHPLPVPTITGPSSVCAGQGNVYYTESGMTGYSLGVFGGAIINNTPPNSLTAVWYSPGIYYVEINYLDEHGCTAANPTKKYVTVNPLPEPTITGPDAFCAKTVQTFTTESGMTGYTWTISEGGAIHTGAGTNEVTASWNSSGVQTISINYTDGNGCAAEHETVKRVTIKPLPDPVISGPATACAGTCNVTYSTEPSMIAYIWTVSPGGTITAGGTVADHTVTVCWNSAGPQSVSVNYLNENGCFAPNPEVKNITVHPLPVPTVTGPASIC